MKIVRLSEERGEKVVRALEGRGRALWDARLEDKVRAIIADVAKRGDRALSSYVRKFDLKGIPPAELKLAPEPPTEEEVGAEFSEAVELALTNLQAFHEPQRPKGYTVDLQGDELAIRVRPLNSVGVYVPGGGAVYLSSLLMAAVPARVAGVERIAVACPPRAYLSSPHLRYLLKRLELREVYLMGGAHAVAALALGTESVTPVDKIVGPGGRWVTAAKRALFGLVDVDLIAGPSEVVVVADGHADPAVVAADLLAQAEHDPDAVAVAVVTSQALAEKVVARLRARLRTVPREAPVRAALKQWGTVLVAESLEQACETVNRIAPEHVELLVEEPQRWADRITAAGAVYLGTFTPVTLGDYVVGSNHVLPTARAARFASPLGVWDFVHRTAVVGVGPPPDLKLAPPAGTFGGGVGPPVHPQ
ncbi:MAG: histidinol dehydrogenase, partial [Thermoanaerobaculum sp.]|nr:histidinol dehydrogenase [Thermoanaerobaculum sp.]